MEEEDPRELFRMAGAGSDEADPEEVHHPLELGRVRVSDSGLVGGIGEVIWTTGPLVGVERPWRISAAGSSGKSAKSIDPVGSSGG